MKSNLFRSSSIQRSNRRRLIQSYYLIEEPNISPQTVWKKYRPLQGFLDSLGSEDRARILQDSRESAMRAIKLNFEIDCLELRGDTLYPLGLILD